MQINYSSMNRWKINVVIAKVLLKIRSSVRISVIPLIRLVKNIHGDLKLVTLSEAYLSRKNILKTHEMPEIIKTQIGQEAKNTSLGKVKMPTMIVSIIGLHAIRAALKNASIAYQMI